ncbi:MAG: M24 family metallopeptidase, partial [Planctomycetes bacterium]|nr:M24 family metallopeptidase [Planctomycetota bacterium]
MEFGDLLVLDIGAEYGWYAADVTRTVPVGGRFTPRQRALYEIVLRAQEAAIREVRPGAPWSRVHETAAREVARGLKALGLIREDAEAGKYFPHGASHGLGLDVHDPMPRGTLEPGMVITVEPGIYIREESLG